MGADDHLDIEFNELERPLTRDAFISVLDGALDEVERAAGLLTDPEEDLPTMLVMAIGEALFAAEVPTPFKEEVDDFVGRLLPNVIAAAGAEAVALLMTLWSRPRDPAEGDEAEETLQCMVATLYGQKATYVAGVERSEGNPPSYGSFELLADDLAPIFDRALNGGLNA